MYADFFGFRELPFNNTPDPRFFYSTPDHEEALASLVYAVQERKGFVLLTGEVGAGKTLVSRMMLRHFGQRVVFANVHHAVQGTGDLMESLCAEFELAVESGASPTRLVHALHDYLLGQFSKDLPVVLVLDEAQRLPAEAFEQLRMIGNLEADDAKLLQIVILGQPELQHRFATPEFRQLRQRIFRTFHLPALSREATCAYIRHRLGVAGSPTLDIFDESAVDRIWEKSQGLPRLINTICDNALLSGYSADRRQIDGEFVDSVVAQMMTLGPTEGPAPSTGAAAAPNGSGTVAGGLGTPVTPASPEFVEMLARRMGELEARMYGLPVFAGMAGQAANAPSPSNNASREVGQIRDELAFKLNEANQRLAELDGKLCNTPVVLAEAREVHGKIEPLVRDANRLVAQTEGGYRVLARQEARVQRMANKVKAVVDEVRGIFDGLKQASIKTRRAERDAQRMHERLISQTEQSRKIADEIVRASSLIGSAKLTEAPRAISLKEVTRPVACEPESIRRLFADSHASLTELRTLVRQATGRRAPAATSANDDPLGSDDSGANDSATRLAHQVESLLDMVSPAGAAGSADVEPANV